MKEADNENKSLLSSKQFQPERLYSIKDLQIREDLQYLTFETKSLRVRPTVFQKFQYVQIRTQKTFGYKLLQVIDISERVMNAMMKNEKALLELMNATVSHEIRNPLNSLMH